MKVRAFLVTLLGLVTAATSQAAVVLSNLDTLSPDNLKAVVNSTFSFAQAFEVGDEEESYFLESIVAPLAVVTNDEFLLEFFIYSDNSGIPGTELIQLTSNVLVIGYGYYTYFPIGSLALDASTIYWLVATTAGEAAYTWDFTENPGYVSEFGWKFTGPMYRSEDQEWFASDGDYLQFSITASPVPEPTVAGLLIGGSLLGFASRQRRSRRG
jgi:hypothetical protein